MVDGDLWQRDDSPGKSTIPSLFLQVVAGGERRIKA
jgi:hypothetical protein